MANVIGKGRTRIRNEDHLTWRDHLSGALKPVAERDSYLQERADANRAAADAARAAEDAARRTGRANRRKMGG